MAVVVVVVLWQHARVVRRIFSGNGFSAHTHSLARSLNHALFSSPPAKSSSFVHSFVRSLVRSFVGLRLQPDFKHHHKLLNNNNQSITVDSLLGHSSRQTSQFGGVRGLESICHCVLLCFALAAPRLTKERLFQFNFFYRVVFIEI